jgi:prophage antirepressor-like protein
MSDQLARKLAILTVCGVRGYEQDDVAYLHIEDVARGLGISRTAESGNEVVRWERVEGYLSDLKFVPTCGHDGNPHDYYIPENIFYRLCMKAKNAVAEAFQAKVADEIIPTLRKTGKYEISKKQDSYLIEDKIERAKRWIEEQEEARAEKAALEVERDAAIQTKAQIGSRREATAMATASAKARECEALREQVGDSKTYKAVTAITWLTDYFDISHRGLYGAVAAKLKKVEADMGERYAHKDIADSRWGKVKAYHVDVVERLHEMVQADEELLSRYRKIASV